jgi:hypothetical protein
MVIAVNLYLLSKLPKVLTSSRLTRPGNRHREKSDYGNATTKCKSDKRQCFPVPGQALNTIQSLESVRLNHLLGCKLGFTRGVKYFGKYFGEYSDIRRESWAN